jgi:acetolactate synthase-1/3 small subunit
MAGRLPKSGVSFPLNIINPFMRHTISVLVENKFGVLARVSGMFSGRGFNIDSLNVAPTHDATLSRITVVLKGDDHSLELCIKQLRKLINVVEVIDFSDGSGGRP